jgi:hypothetical protein
MLTKQMNVVVGDKFYLVELKESESIAFAWASNEEDLRSSFDYEEIEILNEIEITNETVNFHNDFTISFHQLVSNIVSEYGFDEEKVKVLAFKEFERQFKEHFIH